MGNNTALLAPVTNSEIWYTIKNIHAYKAPRPEGIQSIFYHNYWNMVGNDVCKFVKECFDTNSVPREVIKTYIALIQKSDNPENVKNV